MYLFYMETFIYNKNVEQQSTIWLLNVYCYNTYIVILTTTLRGRTVYDVRGSWLCEYKVQNFTTIGQFGVRVKLRQVYIHVYKCMEAGDSSLVTMTTQQHIKLTLGIYKYVCDLCTFYIILILRVYQLEEPEQKFTRQTCRGVVNLVFCALFSFRIRYNLKAMENDIQTAVFLQIVHNFCLQRRQLHVIIVILPYIRVHMLTSFLS